MRYIKRKRETNRKQDEQKKHSKKIHLLLEQKEKFRGLKRENTT